MDYTTSIEYASINVIDLSTPGPVHPDLSLGFEMSTNMYAFCSCYDTAGNVVNINVQVGSGGVVDGLEHTLQAVVDGTSLFLFMDGVLIGSTVALAPLVTKLDRTFIDFQRRDLSSMSYVSEGLISRCPEDFPTTWAFSGGYETLGTGFAPSSNRARQIIPSDGSYGNYQSAYNVPGPYINFSGLTVNQYFTNA